MNKRDTTVRPPEAVAEPSVFDILMGRSGYYHNHVGNRSFRTLIGDNLGWYASVMNSRKREKMAVVTSIMKTIEEGGGRFLRQSPFDQKFYAVGYKTAREKISHALRDQMNQKSTQRRLKKGALQVNSESEEGATEPSDDQWRSLVLKTTKILMERRTSVTPTAKDLPTVQLSDSDAHPWLKPKDGESISEPEGRIMINQAHSNHKLNGPRQHSKQLEVSLEESRKWFRTFTRDTLRESTSSNVGAVARTIGTNVQSSIHGSHNISLKPLPTSSEWLTPSWQGKAEPAHSERNKRGATKPRSLCTQKLSDCTLPVVAMSSPHEVGPPNIVTPQQGLRPPFCATLAQPGPNTFLPRLPKHGLRSPSKASFIQPLPAKSLPRLVSIGSQSCDVDVDSAECSNANDDSASSHKSPSNAEPTEPEDTAFASLFKDTHLVGEDEGDSSNHYCFASVNAMCEDPACFCRSDDFEPLPADFDDASIDLEKLMAGLFNSEDTHGKSCTDQELDEMIIDLFPRD